MGYLPIGSELLLKLFNPRREGIHDPWCLFQLWNSVDCITEFDIIIEWSQNLVWLQVWTCLITAPITDDQPSNHIPTHTKGYCYFCLATSLPCLAQTHTLSIWAVVRPPEKLVSPSTKWGSTTLEGKKKKKWLNKKWANILKNKN